MVGLGRGENLGVFAGAIVMIGRDTSVDLQIITIVTTVIMTRISKHCSLS